MTSPTTSIANQSPSKTLSMFEQDNITAIRLGTPFNNAIVAL